MPQSFRPRLVPQNGSYRQYSCNCSSTTPHVNATASFGTAEPNYDGTKFAFYGNV